MGVIKDILRSVLPQEVINDFYHLPEAVLANVMYGFPTKSLKVIGVTGTDGKTTIVNMIYEILKAAGKKVSMVSTVNAFISGKSYDTGSHVTSPGRFMVQKFAKMAKDRGDEYLVLEATSHALDQHRYWGINFDIAVITNVTHEHLDYHKNEENYFKSKAKLIKNAAFAIVNQNLKERIQEIEKPVFRGKLVTFGLDKGDFNQKQVKLKLNIPGDYNIENALASLAVAFALSITKKIAQKTLENFKGVKGRMEEVKNHKGVKIFIDFAHTPNGLQNVLQALRPQALGKLIALIGCEGKRDEGKRAMMGEIAGKFADKVVITAVDPRGELDSINRQIIEGITKAGGKEGINFFIAGDREKAIDLAINKIAKRGDTVGIFGKGHELSMNLDGKKEIPWSDKEVVDKVLSSSSQYKKALER